jgi:putative ATPase
MTNNKPLAVRIRPKHLNEVYGQNHLTQKTGILNRFIEEKRLMSMIFFGPPGSGKTTAAAILANELNLPLELFNAVTGNKKELDAIFANARLSGQLVMIVDEVHRLNKDKQDLLLPYVEDGSVLMIGLTSANPYFAINPAIRSRCILCEFKAVNQDAMKQAIERALTHTDSQLSIKLEPQSLQSIIDTCNGDVRMAYNILDALNIAYPNEMINLDHLSNLHLHSNLGFDHSDDGYYDALSGLQKSIRGSEVDAALYYLARLIVAEDLESIERRLIVIAYEDIGLANPPLVARTIQAMDAAKRVGFPEAIYPLSVMVIDLALSPKSRNAIIALGKAINEIKEHPLPVPEYLRLTPVGLRDEDKYDYDRPDIWNRIEYLPKGIQNTPFYTPTNSSPYENTLENNLKVLNQIKRTHNIRSLK